MYINILKVLEIEATILPKTDSVKIFRYRNFGITTVGISEFSTFYIFFNILRNILFSSNCGIMVFGTTIFPSFDYFLCFIDYLEYNSIFCEKF